MTTYTFHVRIDIFTWLVIPLVIILWKLIQLLRWFYPYRPELTVYYVPRHRAPAYGRRWYCSHGQSRTVRLKAWRLCGCTLLLTPRDFD